MALVSLRQILDHAAENGYGVPAFNVNNLEQVQAIMSAAQEVGAPVIMQASAGARKYTGEYFLKNLIEAAVKSYPDVPVCMHQDHGQSPSVCQGAMSMGFTSVMMDGSLMSDGKTIASFDYNVEVTRRVVEMFDEIKRDPTPTPERLTLAAQITDANAAVFDTAHTFAGCIPGIHEILRRQGLLKGTWCLNPDEVLSEGQSEELDRILAAYPHLTDDDFVREYLTSIQA